MPKIPEHHLTARENIHALESIDFDTVYLIQSIIDSDLDFSIATAVFFADWRGAG